MYSLTLLFARLFLKIIPDDVTQWKDVLQKQVVDYNELKKNILPSFDKVVDHLPTHSFTHSLTRCKVSAIDPLLASGASSTSDWSSYYKDIELSNFIKGSALLTYSCSYSLTYALT